MGEKSFVDLCKKEIVKYVNLDAETNEIDLDNVFVVWWCKTLQNCKALLSTDIEGDHRYYECTYNGDKKELYVDVYVKKVNYKVNIDCN